MIITKFLTPTVHTQQGDVRLLDGAVLAAGASPLGKAHPLVLHGKQMKEALVKERGRLEFEMREAAHVRIRASAHSIKRTHIRLHIIVRERLEMHEASHVRMKTSMCEWMSVSACAQCV